MTGIRSCRPPMRKEDLNKRCSCGHLGSEHRRELPSPCGVGRDVEAMANVLATATSCVLAAMANEFERQRAAGACPCIAFSPEKSGGEELSPP